MDLKALELYEPIQRRYHSVRQLKAALVEDRENVQSYFTSLRWPDLANTTFHRICALLLGEDVDPASWKAEEEDGWNRPSSETREMALQTLKMEWAKVLDCVA